MDDDIWIDTRWLKPGWSEAYRVRWSGFLPADWMKRAIRQGVVTKTAYEGRQVLTLSDRGRALTDLYDTPSGDDTLRQLAEYLVVRNWRRSWLVEGAPSSGLILIDRDRFPQSYKMKMTQFFDELSAQFKEG